MPFSGGGSGGSAGLGGTSLIYRKTLTGAQNGIDTGVDTADAGSNNWTQGDLLEVFLIGRCSDAANNATIGIEVNNDAGANYEQQNVVGAATTASAGSTVDGTGGWGVLLPANTALASMAGTVHIVIPGFANTTFFKCGVSHSGMADSTAAKNDERSTVIGWKNTAAITRFKAYDATGGNFNIGTMLLIYKRLSTG